MHIAAPLRHSRALRPLALIALALAALAIGGCKVRSYGSHEEPAEQDDVLIYTVVEGDTLSRIAAKYRIDVQSIIDGNRLRDVDLYIGQRLKLPGAHRPYVYQKKTTDTPPVDTTWYRPRSTWAAQAIDLSNIDPMGTVTRITVHHTADDGDVGGDPVSTLKRIEEQHKLGQGKNKPFACIGYHFLIDASGTVWEGRPIQYQGAHAEGDNNKGNIGVCLLGNFDRGRPTPAQQASLIAVLERLRAEYRIPRAQVFGHSHFKNTQCPGRFLEPLVRAYHDGR